MMSPSRRPPPRPVPIATTTVPTPAKKAVAARMTCLPLTGNVSGKTMFRRYAGSEKGTGSRPSDHRGDAFQADDAGERADFPLLVLAQLEQQRHCRRFQLLDFLGIRIDRRRARRRISLLGRVHLAGDGAQRLLD